MSTYYCRPRFIPLDKLAELGFAIAGEVTAIDLPLNALELRVHGQWGTVSPKLLPGYQFEANPHTPIKILINNIPWGSLGKYPVDMYHYSRNIRDIHIGLDIIIVLHLEGWYEDNKLIYGFDANFPVTFEILSDGVGQRHKLDIFFNPKAFANWQEQASLSELTAALEDEDLKAFAFEILRFRQLLTIDLITSLSDSIRRECLQKINSQLTADEMDQLMQEIQDKLLTKIISKEELSRYYDWVHEWQLQQRINLDQSLRFAQHLKIDIKEQRHYLVLYLESLYWFFENKLLGREYLESLAVRALLIDCRLHHSEGDSYLFSFEPYYILQPAYIQQLILLQLGDHLTQKQASLKAAGESDLLLFVLNQAAVHPEEAMLTILQHLDINRIKPTQDRIEARMSMMVLGMKLSHACPHLKMAIIQANQRWLQDDAIFFPDVIVSIGEAEEPEHKRQRWDKTLRDYKHFIVSSMEEKNQ